MVVEEEKRKQIVNKLLADGKDIIDQTGIKRAFYKYYAKLFRKQEIDSGKIKSYLEKVNLPRISEHTKKMFNEPIPEYEIKVYWNYKTEESTGTRLVYLQCLLNILKRSNINFSISFE